MTLQSGSWPPVWDVSNLEPGAGGQLTVTVDVRPSFTMVYTNTAVISSPGDIFATENNTATIHTNFSTVILPLIFKNTNGTRLIY